MISSVLVTGGAGYIGSHTCKSLATDKYAPVVFDNLIRGHREAVRWGELIQADLSDHVTICKVLKEFKIESVIHFASFAYVGESMDEPGRYFDNNVTNTLNLLEAMHVTGVRDIVFSSTCATYGEPDGVPINEDHRQEPVNPYGESKLMVEKLLSWYGKIHGIRWVSLRYFNAAGADATGVLGENHDPEPHLIPRAILAARGVIPAIEVYGTDYDTPDGTCVRDFVHVTDLAAAHIRALEWLRKDNSWRGTSLNLGTGKGTSVREVIAEVERRSGRKVPVRERPRRLGDPPVLVADATRARDVLDWSPRFSCLEEIVRTAWCWHSRKLGTGNS